MDHLQCYHGNIGIEIGESLLLRKGKNGSYLLRDSESVAGALCLCVLYGRFIYTYRIFQNFDGLYMIQTEKGVKEKLFRNLRKLICNYEKPNQGLVHNLVYPVNKESCNQINLQPNALMKCVIPEATYEETDERVYVTVLPS